MTSSPGMMERTYSSVRMVLISLTEAMITTGSLGAQATMYCLVRGATTTSMGRRTAMNSKEESATINSSAARATTASLVMRVPIRCRRRRGGPFGG